MRTTYVITLSTFSSWVKKNREIHFLLQLNMTTRRALSFLTINNKIWRPHYIALKFNRCLYSRIRECVRQRYNDGHVFYIIKRSVLKDKASNKLKQALIPKKYIKIILKEANVKSISLLTLHLAQAPGRGGSVKRRNIDPII